MCVALLYSLEYALKGLSQCLAVVDGVAYQAQIFLVGRVWQPQLYVSAVRILVLHVVQEPLPMLFLVLLRIVVEPILYGAAEHVVWLKVAVGFCHNLAVYAAWRMRRRCTMVFNSLLHYLYLLLAEPAAQTSVGCQYLSACNMVYGTRTLQPEVVVGGYNVAHIDIGAGREGKLKRVLYHVVGVRKAVRPVEGVVSGKYILLDKLHEVEAYVSGIPN